jgi:hypothetical protein
MGKVDQALNLNRQSDFFGKPISLPKSPLELTISGGFRSPLPMKRMFSPSWKTLDIKDGILSFFP